MQVLGGSVRIGLIGARSINARINESKTFDRCEHNCQLTNLQTRIDNQRSVSRQERWHHGVNASFLSARALLTCCKNLGYVTAL